MWSLKSLGGRRDAHVLEQLLALVGLAVAVGVAEDGQVAACS